MERTQNGVQVVIDHRANTLADACEYTPNPVNQSMKEVGDSKLSLAQRSSSNELEPFRAEKISQ